MKCFVIMPFGEKVDADGRTIDFDKIYRSVIKQTIDALNIDCIRCDEIAEAGWIHSKMFSQLYDAEVAVVDITSLNPNVFYEMGVRHAIAPNITVIIKRKGTRIPFNIQDLSVIEYDPEDFANIDEARKRIADYIRNGLLSRKVDSPVHNILNIKIHAEAKILRRQEVFPYKLKKCPDKRICIVTGDIQNIRKLADVWVSSENVNMQMSRHFERSVSAVIRYYGSKRNIAGQVTEDLVADDLRRLVGEVTTVPAGTVIATSSGELERTHGVKRIFHAASVVGMVGKGYAPIADIGTCIRNSLHQMDSDEYATEDLKSILFPLMGTGTGSGNLEDSARRLIECAIAWLEENRTSRVQGVYFVALTDRELQACQAVLQVAPEVVIA